jgi:hypothetical protein
MQYLLPYLLLNMSFTGEERKQEDNMALSLEQRQNTERRKMAVGFLVTLGRWEWSSGHA